MMKRTYLKPKLRTLHLCLNTFITVGSGSNGVNDYINTGGGDNPVNPGGGSDDPDKDDDGSRYLRQSMWDDM